MKHWFLVIVVVWGVAFQPLCGLASPQFFASLSDVPLMPGLVELSDQGYVFDKPQGRIGESLAYGTGMSPADIRLYYQESLPQFGWKSLPDNVYVRDGEEIRLEVERSDEQNLVKISIRPIL